MLKKLIRAIRDPRLFFYKASCLGLLNWMDDALYLKIMYRLMIGQKLDLDNPQTFNEKLQWLKIHDRKDIYTVMADKSLAKKYVADIIGEEYIIPTLGVWNNFDEIDFDKLPNQFVLKCTHDSCGLVIVRDKNKLDKAAVKKKLEQCLKRNYYWIGREWPYKNILPRIIAEEYMEDGSTDVNSNGDKCLRVYKFMTFGGEPKIIQTVSNDKTCDESVDYFDCEWNRLDLRQNYPNSVVPPACPEKLKEMIDKVKQLCNGEGFIRVDFYEINGAIKFSEFTFYSDAGFAEFHPEEWDEKFGSWIDLEKM